MLATAVAARVSRLFRAGCPARQPDPDRRRNHEGLPAMANIKSQKKRNLTNAKRHDRNKALKAELKTRIKTAIETGDDQSMQAAVKRIDMAAAKGVIHKNAAARMKSRMAHAVAAKA